MSIKPGQMTNPAGTSITVASSAGRSWSTRATRSPSMRTSRRPSIPLAGSMTRPPLSSRFIAGASRQEIQHGHTHGYTVGHLVQNHRVRAVGYFGGDLDPAVHWTRVHDDHVA